MVSALEQNCYLRSIHQPIGKLTFQLLRMIPLSQRSAFRYAVQPVVKPDFWMLNGSLSVLSE